MAMAGEMPILLGDPGWDCNDLDASLNNDDLDYDNQSTCDGDCDDNDGGPL